MMPQTPPSTGTLPPPASIAAAVREAAWLAHRYDPGYDAVHLLPVPRAIHRGAIFLTDEYLPTGLQPLVVRRADAMADAPTPAPIHFVFHSAYCCSTLVARAFDRPGWAMGLKEPVILNDVIGWRRRGGQGPDMASVFDDVLTLLARPFQRGEAVVVKPSTLVNPLAATILTLRPNARAVLLYAPLRTYLASIAKKGIDGRLWVRALLVGLIDDRAIDLGFHTRDHLGQTDLQVAAMGWLAQRALFADLVRRFGPARIRTLDSATLMADPGRAMKEMAALFELPLTPRALREILSGPAFTRHSKLGTAFDAADRAVETRQALEIYADEIEKVIVWTEAVAANAGIAMTPTAPLIAGAA
jgi:hypothetical protein